MTFPDYSEARRPRPRRQFTVLLPVVRPPHMLPFAIKSVLAQTDTDFELCIVCDGAPQETAEVARTFAETDPRVHVFAFPKGQRHGELHRAAVLAGAASTFVAHIGDDDLWLSNHLSTLSGLLAEADFVSVPGFTVQPDGCLHAGPFGDLRQARYCRKMLKQRWNFFGPTEAAYRLDAYRRLPDGWSPAPEDLWSDLHMWRKFLRQPGIRVSSGCDLSTLKFATPDWAGNSLESRREANQALWAKLQDARLVETMRTEARRLLARAIKAQHLPGLILSDPLRYLPLLRLRLVFGGPVTQQK
ncbi:MAG: glycosyltransferase [Tabrizicola sp.]|jgi:glycosyltransferase involved in cell wall biosynthesis|nr:glycosyltransferase [Tabrizicola sp.]